MSRDCGTFKNKPHVLPVGYGGGVPYLRATYIITDGIGREHYSLTGICERCGRRVTFASVHGPLTKKGT